MAFLLLLTMAIAAAPPAAALDDGACRIMDAASAKGRVWLLCERERLLRSDDRGATWIESRLPSGVRVRALYFLDADNGFAAGDRGALLATADGGSSWQVVSLPTQEDLRSLYFVGESGWITGYGGVVLHSGDGGRSWNSQATGASVPLEDIFFLDRNLGWAVGWNGAILRTSDGGRRWEQIRSPAAKWSLYAVRFRDPDNGWAVGFLGHLLRTRDGGATWQATPVPVRSTLTSVRFDDSGRGWIASEEDLLVSEDGGDAWRPVGLGGWPFLERLISVEGSVWAVGPFGILRQDGPDTAWKRIDPPNLGLETDATAVRPAADPPGQDGRRSRPANRAQRPPAT
ncbi:MAG: hypothetical protein KIT09_28995 [Bryobacteraceae bacterium]|nr:hypothetical protein [Bryobacteraceae bacterium]